MWPQILSFRWNDKQKVITVASIGTVVVAVLHSIRQRRAIARKPRAEANTKEPAEEIPWKEVAKHKRLDSVWIVIHGEVFDVTSWMEDHPGGPRLLLAFAGRDATEAFECVGHSALARRELRRLRLGNVGGMDHGGWGEVPDAKRPAVKLTGGCRTTSVVACEDRDEKLWEVCNNGFLPCRDPVGIEVLAGTPFQAFADLADLLPALGITGEFRTFLDSSVETQQKLLACGDPRILDDLTEDQLERAFGTVSYTMVAYWRSGTLAYGAGVASASLHPPVPEVHKAALELPAFLAEPLLALSARLERPPMIDYAASVLYNWVRLDPEGPMSTSNIRMIHRFTGLLDEEWFFKTHVIIESEAASAVSALLNATQAGSFGELLSHLVALEEALWRVVRAGLPIMYERSRDGIPHCSEHIFYHVLRPLIASGKLLFQDSKGDRKEVKLTGPSGAMSSLLPLVDAALGIKTSSDRLRQALDLFEQSMPKEHRQVIGMLRSKSSIRARIQHGAPRDTEQYEALTRSFNRCIARVLDFRWQHWQYVKNFIMKPGNISFAVGSGGTSFDYLQQHITDTQEARLIERGEQITRIASPGEPDILMAPRDLSSHPIAYQRGLELWSVDGVNGLLARQPMNGLEEDWVQAMPEAAQAALQVLWRLLKKLPSLTAAEGPLNALVEIVADDLAPLRSHESLMGISEVALERLMTMLCHISAACSASDKRKAPKCIERPLQVVARALGRPPKLNFTELVLSNWTETVLRKNSTEMEVRELPETAVEEEQNQEVAPKLHMVLRFLACPDEEWYRATHMLLHKEAREVVAAIRCGQVAARECNTEAIVESLAKLTTWLNTFCDYFDGHFENKDSRSESVSFARLSKFVAQGMEEVEVHCWVYTSGGSVLLPAIHAYLGVQMWPGNETDGFNQQVSTYAITMRRFLEESRVSMPRLHRVFLEDLERPGSSLRQFCFRRFGAKSVSVEGLHTLEVSYNDCLNAITRFLSRRARLVSRFFPAIQSTFGVINSHVEESLRKSRLKLLQMRQNVDRCLEK